MDDSQKAQFVEILKTAMGAYAKPLPEKDLIVAWWGILKAYPISVVAQAFGSYCDEEARFAPVPAAIAQKCRTCDGRPGPEEAWAIAITSRDESDTVVWTQEAAEAFALCQPVLDMGDEVGARMAFKEAYVRLVTAARTAGAPARWSASLGWDVEKRTAVLTRAATAGLLPAPRVAALLPPPAASVPHDDKATAQIASIKEMMARMAHERESQAQAWAERERKATADAKALMNALTANYRRDDAA